MRTIVAVLAVLAALGISVAYTIGGIAQVLQTSYPETVPNDGTGIQRVWWRVTFDSQPVTIVHTITDASGATVHADEWAPDADWADREVLNPEYVGGWTEPHMDSNAHEWLVPTGTTPGTYTSLIEYYSTQGLEASAGIAFGVAESTACKPGWGWGDKNHCHSGPPGQE